jgi:hypothetical protein
MPGSQSAGDPLVISTSSPGKLPVVSDVPFDEYSAFLLCRKLRSKLALSAIETSDGEPVSAIAGLDGTAVFWCLSTMECAGPDGALAHSSECHSERGCYQSKG